MIERFKEEDYKILFLKNGTALSDYCCFYLEIWNCTRDTVCLSRLMQEMVYVHLVEEQFPTPDKYYYLTEHLWICLEKQMKETEFHRSLSNSVEAGSKKSKFYYCM